ncbi:hypothetical protein PIB30_069999 [Stylosanthes scabra]|uniref:Uncharacterized protein n=1 Tax=Stylosanthes scabra TaxID=79078 RepID=A0ABU6QMX6_9FABA|nr:hypothetical protein [Stylosanthes scabra]
MASTDGFFPLLFRRNPNRAPTQTSKFLPSPFSVEPPSEPPKPPVVFSITDSRGEGSLEYHQDPHLGNGAVDPTLAVRVCWRRRGDVAAATTTVEPRRSIRKIGPPRLEQPPSFLVAPSSPSFLAAPSSRPVTPSHPLFNFNHRSPLKAQGTVLTECDAAQRFVPASLLHHRHKYVLHK